MSVTLRAGTGGDKGGERCFADFAGHRSRMTAGSVRTAAPSSARLSQRPEGRAHITGRQRRLRDRGDMHLRADTLPRADMHPRDTDSRLPLRSRAGGWDRPLPPGRF
jgi:hypothetical protein